MSKDNGESQPTLAPPEEKLSESEHTIVIGGQEIKYKATAGTLVLKEEDDEKNEKEAQPKASVFYVAYTQQDVEDVDQRPLTFAFNGGPGSSSVWLHLGLLGPRRVLLNEDGNPPPPPYRLVDNAHSLLDVSDLVFIDPVSTGYSRAVPGVKPDQFHSIDKDIESVGEFIRLYTTRYQRWSSPKFLSGESYGTTRSAGLSGYLQDRHGYYLNGIMLISSILDFQTAHFTPGNDLAYILFLPTYTATAWYHQQLDDDLQADLQKTLRQVEAFALGEYALALLQGAALDADERANIMHKLARYTGLSPDYVERSDLRIEIMRFTKELLRKQKRTVGRLDTRFTGIDRDAAGETFEFDPSYSAIQGPYTAALNAYVRGELCFESDLPYEILSNRVHPWSYNKYQNQYVNVAETLRQAMCKNPALKVFVANGYFDLATPYFATEYTFNHLRLDPSLRGNISMSYYNAGHMMYIHQPSLVKLKADLATFVNSTI